MNELAIELDLEGPEMRLDLLEVLDFGLFASPTPPIRPFGSAYFLENPDRSSTSSYLLKISPKRYPLEKSASKDVIYYPVFISYL
jgi:hypothetical protein